MTYSVQAESTLTPYRVTLTDASGHTWHADEPADKGGQDTAPNPVQLFTFCFRCLHYHYLGNVREA